MASFSNIGIGLGGNVDVNGLIKASKDAVMDKITRTNGLSDQGKLIEAKISTYGQLKSLASTLSDAVDKLTSVTGWNAVTASSSNKEAITATAIGGTVATSFSVQVKNLASAQSTSTAAMLPLGGFVGAGTLKLEAGKWSGTPESFTAGEAAAVEIDITATDKLSDIASKINGSNAGVTATILTDASGERLLLRSKSTGEDVGFRMSATDSDGNDADAAGLSRLVTGATTQYGANAKALINGIEVSSASNTFANTVAGVTFNALQVTSTAVDITVARDDSAVKANVDGFVKAYNAMNQALNQITRFDKESGTIGLLQGDSSAVVLHNTLRNSLQALSSSSGPFKSLSDVGIVTAGGGGNLSPTGDLQVDSAKLTKALENPDALKAMFRGPEGGTTTDGVGEQIKGTLSGLLSTDGFFASKDKQLTASKKRNDTEIVRVNDRANRVESDMKARYTTLDTKMATLNALNTYIQQQVTTWNKSS